MITPEQKTKIRELSATVQQKQIAKQLGLSTYQVRKVQNQFGMRPHKPVEVSPETEKQIFALLDQNHGAPYVALTLGLRQYVVEAVISRRGYVKPRGTYGCKYNLSDKTLSKIRRAICKSEKAIARQFGVSHEWLRRFRLKMWNSTGENNWRRKRAGAVPPADYSALADRIEKYFHGQFPDCPEDIANAAMASVPALRSAPTKARKYFHRRLAAAIRARIADDAGMQNPVLIN